MNCKPQGSRAGPATCHPPGGPPARGLIRRPPAASAGCEGRSHIPASPRAAPRSRAMLGALPEPPPPGLPPCKAPSCPTARPAQALCPPRKTWPGPPPPTASSESQRAGEIESRVTSGQQRWVWGGSALPVEGPPTPRLLTLHPGRCHPPPSCPKPPRAGRRAPRSTPGSPALGEPHRGGGGKEGSGGGHGEPVSR